MLTKYNQHLEKAIDVADAAIHDILASRLPAVRQLEGAIRDFANAVSPEYSARLVVTITLIDVARGSALPIPLAIYQTDGTHSPDDITEDSRPQRFTVGETDVTVPRGICPRCWSTWPGAEDGSACSRCGLALGRDCSTTSTPDSAPE